MNVDEWKRGTNAGATAIRTDDLRTVDRVLQAYLDEKTQDNLNDLSTTLALWKNTNLHGRAHMFRDHTALLERWIALEQSALTNKAVALSAFNATRTHYAQDANGFVVKSTNKQIFEFDDPSRNTVAHMLKVAASSLRYDRASAAQATHGRMTPALRAATSGNCGEMSLFSYDHVLAMANHPPVARFGFRYRDGVNAPIPDHVFCVVGSPINNAGNEVQMNEALPVNMDEWPADLWIVDAWATLCCAATDYFAKFRTKAQEWSSKGLKIAYRGNWVDPSSNDYIQSLVYADKVRQH